MRIAGLASKEVSLTAFYYLDQIKLMLPSKSSARLRLRIMDSIHIAFARLINELKGLDFSIISDEELLRKRALIRSVSRLKILSPAEFSDLMGG